MSKRHMQFSCGLVTACLAVVLTWTMASGQNEKKKSVEQIVPENTVLFVGADGSGKHAAKWEKTAAYEAMVQSGLQGVFEKFFEGLAQQAGADDSPEKKAAEKLLADLDQQGVIVAVSLPVKPGPPLPQVTIVLQNCASNAAALTNALTMAGGMAGMQLEASEVNGRSVLSGMVPETPGIEIGAWAESGHFVIAAGINAVANTIEVASGEAPSLADNETWKKYSKGTRQFDPKTVAWLDFAKLRQTFGPMPLPVPNPEADGTINGVLKVLGLHNLETVAYKYGYKGRSLWTEMTVEIDGPRTGLLGLCDAKTMTIADLPPLPVGVSTMHAMRSDVLVGWRSLTDMVRAASEFGPPGASDQVNGILDNLPSIAGFDPEKDLLEPLGDVMCIYSDSNQGFFGTGISVVVKVDDADALRQTVNQLLEMGQEAARGEFSVIRSEKYGREIIQFSIENGGQVGALTIDKDWMILALMPQTVEAFLARIDGKLPSWSPDAELAEALAQVPNEFTSLTLGNPRDSWGVVMKAAPLLVNAGVAALNESGLMPPGMSSPISIADIPAAELVTTPLFPNITIQTVDNEGLHIITRQSLPGVPLLSGMGGGSSVATTGVLVALLLPAIQQAREAARRTQSRNNMKQLGLAMHNYADSYGHFPAGTHPNEKLDPEERLSWMASILPFLDQQALWNSIDFDEAWDAEENEEAVSVSLPNVLNPGSVATSPNDTHYIGMAGVGKDAPTLPANHKRAGIFGYNRKTRFRDITDGTSNTIAITEASHSFGPWAQGGSATVRPLTQKPYINGPDGIGGPYAGGANVLLGDGSVRFVSENIDPSVFEALSTAAGGEVISDF